MQGPQKPLKQSKIYKKKFLFNNDKSLTKKIQNKLQLTIDMKRV